VDVAHNPQAAQALADVLMETPITGRTLAVVAMLADKAVADVVVALQAVVDEWFVAGLDVPRGLDAESMAKAMNASGTDVKLTSQQTVTAACEQALQQAQHEDRIIVFGSFYTVAEAVDFFKG
jgi:dihydrofolate synthase/folylpolyglutamate synthase